MIHDRPLTQVRTEEDRTPECQAFIDEVTEVCRKHGYVIGHQETDRQFEVYRYTVRAELEPHLSWFEAADEVIWIRQPKELEPAPERLAPGPIQDPFE
jgi:hypothetical protein